VNTTLALSICSTSREQLESQRERKRSLEQRGQASVAVSGGLVTLLLAFSDVKIFDPTASVATSRWVTLAIGLLVFGALAGVYVTAPSDYAEASVAGMRQLVDLDRWKEPVEKGEMKVADNLLDMIDEAKRANGTKAWVLIGAVGLQVLGVCVMAVTLAAGIFA
jgi:hypothetical protein